MFRLAKGLRIVKINVLAVFFLILLKTCSQDREIDAFELQQILSTATKKGMTYNRTSIHNHFHKRTRMSHSTSVEITNGQVPVMLSSQIGFFSDMSHLWPVTFENSQLLQ